MSNTPRADSQLLTVKDCSYVAPHPSGEYVHADFARQLERENAELREAFAKADVMYEYGRDDGQRRWVTFSMWIRKGQIVVLMDTAALIAARKEAKP